MDLTTSKQPQAFTPENKVSLGWFDNCVQELMCTSCVVSPNTTLLQTHIHRTTAKPQDFVCKSPLKIKGKWRGIIGSHRGRPSLRRLHGQNSAKVRLRLHRQVPGYVKRLHMGSLDSQQTFGRDMFTQSDQSVHEPAYKPLLTSVLLPATPPPWLVTTKNNKGKS